MDEIAHAGIVSRVYTDKLFVTIISQSACSACHARGSCIASDMEEKEIEVSDYKGHYEAGQQVSVIMRNSAGTKAILLGYFFPFIVLMVSLVTVISLTGSEIAGGLAAIGMLVPYYAALYFFRGKIQKGFRFELKAT